LSGMGEEVKAVIKKVLTRVKINIRMIFVLNIEKCN